MRIDVVSAQEMFDAVMQKYDRSAIFFYRLLLWQIIAVKQIASQKIPKKDIGRCN